MSMLIDFNRNVGIGTNEVYTSKPGVGPILQIGNDNKTVNSGQLLVSKFNGSDGSRTYSMSVDDSYNLAIGDCGAKGQADRKYDVAIVVNANNQNVVIAKSLIVNGSYSNPSDIRIKKDIVSSDKAASLNILKSLNIADYRHIDPVNFGDQLVKGLIAQQVEHVFPEAVVTSKGFLPDILSAPIFVAETNGVVTFEMAQPHLLSKGDIVKIHTHEGNKEKTITIVDDHSFSVEGRADEYQNNVLIYGKQVDDFKSIEYNRLFILNLSATQQLAKEYDKLKSKNTALEAMIAGFEQRLNELVN